MIVQAQIDMSEQGTAADASANASTEQRGSVAPRPVSMRGNFWQMPSAKCKGSGCDLSVKEKNMEPFPRSSAFSFYILLPVTQEYNPRFLRVQTV
jgi:hypothetical protein